MKVKSKNKFQSIDIVVLALLALYTVTLIVLLGWGLLSSLKTYEDIKLGNYFGLPNLSLKGSKEAFAFGNYLKILFGNTFEVGSVDASYESLLFGEVQNAPDVVFGLFDCLFYSFLYSIVCSFVHAFVAFTCAFLCAKYKFRFSEFIYVLMLIVMAIPIVGSAPSMLIFLRDLGIYDTVFAMVAMNFNFTGMYFFVFHAHLSGLSNTYMEAAEIDGASQFGIYLKIIFPLCAKVFFTVFLLQFIQTWNDYQTPLLYYPNHPTLSYAVFKAVRDTSKGGLNELSIPNKVASCMVLALPILIVFIAFNKVLMGNITMGGLKE